MTQFELSEWFDASPFELYELVVDAETHAAATGAAATSARRPGGAFTASDGYITGSHVSLEPGLRVVQRWRTTDFLATDADSLVEWRFEPEAGGTRVVLCHRDLPVGQGARCAEGWRRQYFARMHDWLARR
jgi:activator of HSP90 ATPase